MYGQCLVDENCEGNARAEEENMNKDIEAPLNKLIDEINTTPYRLHYVKDIPSHLWIEYRDEAAERIQILRQPEHEVVLRMNCNLVETEQVSLKIICELYEALNRDRDLALRLSKEYRDDFVAIYNPLKNKMKYIIKHGDSFKKQIEKGSSSEKKMVSMGR